MKVAGTNGNVQQRTSMSDDIVAPRDINCLSDDNRQTRKRALTKLGGLPGAGHSPEVLAAVWSEQLRTPVLRLFADQVEKNRELAITLVTDMLAALPDSDVASSLAHVMPAVTSRLGGAVVAEGAEELRLQLLQLVQAQVPRCGAMLAPHLPELVQVLVASFADPFPDAKKEGCALATALAAALGSQIETHCAPLIAGLAPALTHQHSRVRSMGTETLFALLLYDSSILPEVGPQLALISVDRAPAVREQAVGALTELLAQMPSRREHAPRLLPLLLCALSDEVEAIQQQARLALNRLGDLFAADDGPPPLDISDNAELAHVAEAARPAGDMALEPPSSAKEAKKAAAASAAASYATDVASTPDRLPPAALSGTLFAAPPHPPAASLVGGELKALLPPLLVELGDWTTKTRQRSAARSGPDQPTRAPSQPLTTSPHLRCSHPRPIDASLLAPRDWQGGACAPGCHVARRAGEHRSPRRDDVRAAPRRRGRRRGGNADGLSDQLHASRACEPCMRAVHVSRACEPCTSARRARTITDCLWSAAGPDDDAPMRHPAWRGVPAPGVRASRPCPGKTPSSDPLPDPYTGLAQASGASLAWLSCLALRCPSLALAELNCPALRCPSSLWQLHSADPDAGYDAGVITKRGHCLTILSCLVAGAGPAALRPLLPTLTEAVAVPTFCVQPAGIDDERAATYTATQARLCAFLRSLIERTGADCAADPTALHIYSALMRLAAVPSTAGRGFEAQRAAIETVNTLAAAAGHTDAAPLHKRLLPCLVSELLGDGSEAASAAKYGSWQVHRSPCPAAPWSAAPGSNAPLTVPSCRVLDCQAHTHEWHLLQALLRQCDGATAASQLLVVVPCLARLLDPKQEPVLRGTALALLDSLLDSPDFTRAAELNDWAELILQARDPPSLG